jgi:hypothetical protein
MTVSSWSLPALPTNLFAPMPWQSFRKTLSRVPANRQLFLPHCRLTKAVKWMFLIVPPPVASTDTPCPSEATPQPLLKKTVRTFPPVAHVIFTAKLLL